MCSLAGFMGTLKNLGAGCWWTYLKHRTDLSRKVDAMPTRFVTLEAPGCREMALYLVHQEFDASSVRKQVGEADGMDT